MTSMSSDPTRPTRTLYLGLFLITMATLLFELGLTRLFSVVMYYHMAFFAVSVTLFGMAFGGVVVHFLPRVFTAGRAQLWMGRMAMGFAFFTLVALAVLLTLHFDLSRNSVLIAQICLVSLALAIPFTCSGVAVALALTRFPRRTNLLYGVDLAGAALGCLLYAPLITRLGGPGFILLVASVVALAALLLLAGRPCRSSSAIAAALVGLTMFCFAQRDSLTPFRLRHMRGGNMTSNQFAFEGWNAISRITAFPDNGNADGVAPENHAKAKADQHTILIDTFAATPVIKFDGKDFSRLYYPFHDISYLVHAIKQNARVAVIGVGGGRDVLAAKAWGQPEVDGIEINSRVRQVLLETLHDYAGRPTQWPGVHFYLDEARSRITRGGKQYDIIQASLIDTFAATAAGAFVLTENALYTIEGWNVFLDHLKDDGILTMSRWYTPGNPVESIRLIALARATLEGRGVKDFRQHILMARTPQPDNPAAQPLATILVKKSPFTPAEIAAFEKWVAGNGHLPVVTPQKIFDENMQGMLTAPDLMTYANAYRYDLTPPTDDHPFFFDVLRWRDILNKDHRQGSDYIRSINMKPLIMLGSLLATVCLMAFGLIVVPLFIENRRRKGAQALPGGKRAGMMLYFIMLGLAYLMIELTLMQRFTVFLGHPSYSLTVCLFTMLLSSGLGSMAAPRIFAVRHAAEAPRRLFQLNLAICAVLLVTLTVALWVMGAFAAASTPLRIVLTAVTIAPAAFLMGMAFPLALESASRLPQAPLAWFWGLNGAFSVCASVLTIVLAHSIGLSGAYYCGAACYFVAALAGRSFGPLAGGEVGSEGQEKQAGRKEEEIEAQA